jgi:hypothetical protein
MDLRPPLDNRGLADDSAPRRLSFEQVHRMGLATHPLSLAGEILSGTWSTYQARFSACWIVYWGEVLANWSILVTAFFMISGLNDAFPEPMLQAFSGFLVFLIQIIVPVWLQIGLNLALLKIVRQEPVALEVIFRGGRYLLTTLLATAVVLAVASVPVLVVYYAIDRFLSEFAFFSDNLGALVLLSAVGAPLPVLESINANLSSEWNHGVDLVLMTIVSTVGLGSILVLFLLARLGQFGYLILDRNAGVLESLRGSWRLTRGRVTTVFLMYLAHVAINLAGGLAFCVGLFFTLPLTGLLLVTTYDALSEGSRDGEPAFPEAPETNDA